MATGYPPTIHHSTTHVSASEALSLLSTYLSATTTDPSLHPGAHLTEHGPVAPSAGPHTGPVLHNLRRVEAGLRGEHLGEDLTFRKPGNGNEGDGLPDLMMVVAPDGTAEVVGDDDTFEGDGTGERGDGEGDGEWQDKAEFERQQEIVQGEIGKRDNAVNGGFEEGAGVPQVKATWGPGDKEARKKAKKERKEKDRRERFALRQRERDAE